MSIVQATPAFGFTSPLPGGARDEVFRLGNIPEVHSRTCTWELAIALDKLKSDYDTEAIRQELSQLDARDRAHVEAKLAHFEQPFPKEDGQ